MEADASRAYIVVSAPGKRFPGDEKVTDLLYQCQSLAAAGEPFDLPFERIRNRFVSIERELQLHPRMERELKAIEQALSQGASAAYAASRGEYLTALLLSEYLGFAFMDAADLVCFHSDGTLDDITTRSWAASLAEKAPAVIPGFYGREKSGQIATFTRGGSDISGAIVARAVRADVYENWTDVDGFLMADPRIVKDPRIIEAVSYSELRELAYMGATVLHEEAIFPVRKARIPIHVRNTNNPDAPGTRIENDGSLENARRRGPVTGIAGKRGFTVITLTKDNMHKQVGFAARLLNILCKYNIEVESMPSGIDNMSVVLNDSEIRGKMDAIYHDIRTELQPDTVEIASCIALIATVGRGMARIPGVAARLFASLKEAGVNVRIIDQGPSEMNVIVGVEQRDFEKAVRAIYKAFC